MNDAAREAIDDPRLLPLLPVVYAAWADGELTEGEIGAIGDVAAWLPEDSAVRLRAWLDPETPPTATMLLRLRRTVREHAACLPAPATLTLAELAGALAATTDDGPDAAAVQEALERADEKLGFVGTEATRAVLSPELPLPGHAVGVGAATEPAFEVEAMQGLLEAPYADQRRRVREILAAPEFRYVDESDRDAYREQVMTWVRILTDAGLGELAFPGVTTERSAGLFFATFETLASFDLSLLTKFGVQFGLFGGSIYHLGTQEQRQRYLPAVATLELPGCFAMSELGHGSNVRDVLTVARFEPETDEFVVDTPCEEARKEWIGNAALHGRMATVFAQLQIGDDAHGVHAFLVPLRGEDGQALPGVTIEDCGAKMGLNGVDNGRLWFDHVRIPRGNLLSRFGQVAADGEYSSSIPSPGRRFFTMLRTLVGGRVAVGSAGVAVARSALTIAVRYTSRRRQFGPPGRPETPILDYRVQQLRLMPLLAQAYAHTFAIQGLVERLLAAGEEDSSEVEALAAGVKALATDNATKTVQTCREACGGQGYLTSNRFAALKADSDIFVTYEGDNTVLMQLVAKGQLASFRAQFGDNKLLGTVRHLAGQAATAVTELNPVATRQRSEEHLRDPEFHDAAFEYRESQLVASLAGRLKHRIDEGMEPFDALNECQDHALAAAHAYVERAILQEFTAAVERARGAGVRDQLVLLRDLWALSRLHEDAAWFLVAGYFEPPKAKAIRVLVGRLSAAVRLNALPLVDAFAIPDGCLAAPIGLGADWG